MTRHRKFTHAHVDLRVDDVEVNVAALHRDGEGAPIVFLHGFGSTKESYADIVLHEAFADHALQHL